MAQNPNPQGQSQSPPGANQSGNQGLLNPERRGYGGVVDEEMPGGISPSGDESEQAGTGHTQSGQGDQNQVERTKP